MNETKFIAQKKKIHSERERKRGVIGIRTELSQVLLNERLSFFF